MTGVTHLLVGTAAVSPLIKIHPKMIIFLPFAVLGALLPDVDADYSLIQNILFILFYILWGIAATIVTPNDFVIIAFFAILFISILLKKYTEHRTAAHSLLFLAIFGLCILTVSKIATLYFVIGYATHLFLDMLTWHGVTLFYPFKKMIKITSEGKELEIYFMTFSVFFIFSQLL